MAQPPSFLQWGHRCRRPSNSGAKYSMKKDMEKKTDSKEVNDLKDSKKSRRKLRRRNEKEKEKEREKERRDVWVSLSRDEIEEDMYAMTGRTLTKRPKKRPKIVQKHLDIVFPGMYLVGVTADAYRVDETTK